MSTKAKTMEVCDEVKELLASEGITTPEEEKEEEVVEKEIVYTPIVMQILGINEQLADLDDYFNELPNLQSQIDEELSDLLHYIENNDLTPKQSTKMIKLLKQKRTVRRGLCNDYEIKKVYNAHKGKLAIDTQRPFFLSEIHKKAKELNSTYKSRQLSDEQIKELIK